MAKAKPVHFDLLGQPLDLGDCVAFPSHNQLQIATVIKLNNIMVKVQKVTGSRSSWDSGEHNKYPKDLVRLDGPEVTMYLLKNTK